MVPIQKLATLLGDGKSGVESGDPVCHEESYEWFVLKVTPALVDALVALSDSEAKRPRDSENDAEAGAQREPVDRP